MVFPTFRDVMMGWMLQIFATTATGRCGIIGALRGVSGRSEIAPTRRTDVIPLGPSGRPVPARIAEGTGGQVDVTTCNMVGEDFPLI